jgi:hypothetical protein
MSVCVSWSTEHGCTRCRNRRECGDQGLSPFDSATALEMNALVDAEVLPESYRREFHAIARAVGFAGTEGGGCRITLELERDDGVWYEIEEGDKVKVVMVEKNAQISGGIQHTESVC